MSKRRLPSSSSSSPSREEQKQYAESSRDVVNVGSLDNYEVIKMIGKGKFSTVHRAKLRSTGQLVALKKIQIFDMMDAKGREKCLKEVRLLQSLSHPNIIRYDDSFIDGNELVIVFEWAEAGDLKRQIRKAAERRARFDERVVWKYFSQVCDAIQHMHKQRIMHRDLKPANIFLMADGRVKVGDLGLGRHFSEETMQAHSKVGTPLYMSPEVLKNEGYDWKSDIWSLGCILYELAVLRSPFKEEGLNLYRLFQKINKGEYKPIPSIYSDQLRDLVKAMLRIDSKARPSIDRVCDTALKMRDIFEKKRAERKAREKREREAEEKRRQREEQQDNTRNGQHSGPTGQHSGGNHSVEEKKMSDNNSNPHHRSNPNQEQPNNDSYTNRPSSRPSSRMLKMQQSQRPPLSSLLSEGKEQDETANRNTDGEYGKTKQYSSKNATDQQYTTDRGSKNDHRDRNRSHYSSPNGNENNSVKRNGESQRRRNQQERNQQHGSGGTHPSGTHLSGTPSLDNAPRSGGKNVRRRSKPRMRQGLSPYALADELLDKIALLQDFRPTLNLHASHFVLPSSNPFQQFQLSMQLVSQLIQRCTTHNNNNTTQDEVLSSMFQYDPDKPARNVALELLDTLKRLQAPDSLLNACTPQSLVNGYGTHLCTVLSWLVEKNLAMDRFQFTTVHFDRRNEDIHEELDGNDHDALAMGEDEIAHEDMNDSLTIEDNIGIGEGDNGLYGQDTSTQNRMGSASSIRSPPYGNGGSSGSRRGFSSTPGQLGKKKKSQLDRILSPDGNHLHRTDNHHNQKENDDNNSSSTFGIRSPIRGVIQTKDQLETWQKEVERVNFQHFRELQKRMKAFHLGHHGTTTGTNGRGGVGNRGDLRDMLAPSSGGAIGASHSNEYVWRRRLDQVRYYWKGIVHNASGIGGHHSNHKGKSMYRPQSGIPRYFGSDVLGKSVRASSSTTSKWELVVLLQNVADMMNKQVTKVSEAERQLSTDNVYKEMLNTIKDGKQNQVNVRKSLDELSTTLQSHHAKLENITEALDKNKFAIAQHSESASDTTPLHNIRQALKQIQSEIKEMDIRIGVAMHNLLNRKAKEGR
eukprot:g1834.t1